MTLCERIGYFLSKLFPNIGKELDEVLYIGGADTLPAPLSKEEEQRAFELMKTDGKKAREMLIVHNLRLVVYISKKFETPTANAEDLISIGTIGLIKAVRTFCPEK